MPEAARRPAIISHDAMANVETSVTIPVAIVALEIIVLDMDDGGGTDANARFAWISGQTASGGGYVPLEPDWWADHRIQLPANTVIYLLSEIDNTFKIQYWED